jgi:DNA repair exonuclease SbcCD nuclease subunit
MAKDLVRVLHTSDVHIGAFTEKWAPQPDKCLHAFRAIVDRAVQEQVDLVLIAGDFFDHNRVRQEVTDFVLDQLVRLPMPTVILPGNHDPLEKNAAYWRMDLAGKAPRVHLIKDPEGETVRFPELGMAIWGRPHISYDDVSLLPLRNLPPRGPEPWQIAVGHGHFVRDEADGGRAYPIYPQDIADCGRDYVALGHWDAHMDITQGSVRAFYPGSPTWVGLSSIVEFKGANNGSKQITVKSFPVTL